MIALCAIILKVKPACKGLQHYFWQCYANSDLNAATGRCRHFGGISNKGRQRQKNGWNLLNKGRGFLVLHSLGTLLHCGVMNRLKLG